jgi:glutathione peroxidase
MYLSAMTLRQRLLSLAYPVARMYTFFFGNRGKILENIGRKQPAVDFYSLSATLNSEKQLNFSSLKHKKVLIVNTASDCLYTAQYRELQQLHEKFKDSLVIIAFPSNDFNEQEKGSDEAIKQFCANEYGIEFLLAQKALVKSSESQHEVYKWLTNPLENGWNSQQPVWNFSKYLVDENGTLLRYFGPAVSPGYIGKMLSI